MFGWSGVAWALFVWISFAAACFAQEKWVNPADQWEPIGPRNGTLLVYGGYHGGKGADEAFILLGEGDRYDMSTRKPDW